MADLTLLRLAPDGIIPATGRQLGFWGGDQAAADRAERALARVQGMLGPDSVVVVVPQGGRTPTERVRWVPWGEPREPSRDVRARWPGAIPGPAPARVFDPPHSAELLDGEGRAVTVSARGEVRAEPVTLRCRALPAGGGRIEASAGPWPHDLRWWDRATRRRCASWQVLVDGVACLVTVEGGAARVTAVYD